MPVRRPSLLNLSRRASVEPWMAWRRLHCLNPSVQTAIERAGYDGWSSGVCDASGYDCRVSGRALLANWAIVNGLKDANGTPKPSWNVNCIGMRDRLQPERATNGLRRRSIHITRCAGCNGRGIAGCKGKGCRQTRCFRREVCVMQIAKIVLATKRRFAGEPHAGKLARGVRRGAVGKVPTGQLAGRLPYIWDCRSSPLMKSLRPQADVASNQRFVTRPQSHPDATHRTRPIKLVCPARSSLGRCGCQLAVSKGI